MTRGSTVSEHIEEDASERRYALIRTFARAKGINVKIESILHEDAKTRYTFEGDGPNIEEALKLYKDTAKELYRLSPKGLARSAPESNRFRVEAVGLISHVLEAVR